MIFIWSHLRSVYRQHREACLLCVQDTESLTRPGPGRADSRKVWACWFSSPLIIHTPKIASLPLQGEYRAKPLNPEPPIF